MNDEREIRERHMPGMRKIARRAICGLVLGTCLASAGVGKAIYDIVHQDETSHQAVDELPDIINSIYKSPDSLVFGLIGVGYLVTLGTSIAGIGTLLKRENAMEREIYDYWAREKTREEMRKMGWM